MSQATTREKQPSRVYLDHHLDSRRWAQVALRPGDIIVSTAPKCGTTWTQRILATLLHGEKLPMGLWNLSPWVDARFTGQLNPDFFKNLEALPGRRVIKAHLPFDALPYDPQVHYVCVGRDGRDVALSLYNHYSAYTDTALGILNAGNDPKLAPFVRAPGDVHAFLETWLTKGTPAFPWEHDGAPFQSLFYQVQSFWDWRHLPNLHFLHYADLKRDLEGEAGRLAAALEIPAPLARLADVARVCSFEAMKADAIETMPELNLGFEGGANRFFNKGVSGGWRAVFTPRELELYEAAMKATMTEGAAHWLQNGGRV